MEYVNCCFIYNPYKTYQLPFELKKDNTLFYPESGMTFEQQLYSGRPNGYNIVTDSPFLVSLYKNDEVFIYVKNKWINPDMQTYGASYNLIIHILFGYNSSIPQAIIDGKITNIMGHPIKK